MNHSPNDQNNSDDQETATENHELNPVHEISFGQRLKNLREEKGFSLKYIAQQTRISTRILDHIENENTEQLPNKTYVVGFLKSYSKVLGIPPEPLIENLSQFYSQTNINQEESLGHPLESGTRATLNQRPMLNVGITLAVIVVLGILIALFNQFDQLSPEQMGSSDQGVLPEAINEQTPLNDNSEILPTEVIKTEETTETLSETSNEESTEANEEESATVKDIATSENTNEQNEQDDQAQEDGSEPESEPEETDEKLTLGPLSTSLYSVNNEATTEQLSEWLPSNYKNAVKEGTQNLFINAIDGDTWITYQSDDGPIKKFTLREGRKLMIRGQLIQIFFGNINATKVFLDNQLLDIPSNKGVKSVVFPQTKASEFKIPLFIYNKDGSVISSQNYSEEKEQD